MIYLDQHAEPNEIARTPLLARTGTTSMHRNCIDACGSREPELILEVVKEDE